jgi:aerobic-type carbon monoxide dehydrogenase small subunit (CoxS/CutS family)
LEDIVMVTLKINGEDHSVDILPDMPLLWVLRDVVGLTGIRFAAAVWRYAAPVRCTWTARQHGRA